MNEKDSRSKLLYNFGNNLITIGNLDRPMDCRDRDENWFVAEVANEFIHLPYDTFLIPFLKELSVPTKSTEPDDVKRVRCWDLKESYLKSDRTSHQTGLSVQSDLTILLDDYSVLFEFKKPHSTHSQNKVELKQLGRQILLANKHIQKYDLDNFKIILINNSAPLVHMPNRGTIDPNKIFMDYFESDDHWLEHPAVESLLDGFDPKDLEQPFIVKTWTELIETSISVIDDAKKDYDDKGIKKMFENSKSSLEWFLERREHLLDEY